MVVSKVKKPTFFSPTAERISPAVSSGTPPLWSTPVRIPMWDRHST